MNKISINFCPTGMVPTKQMTPYVPVSPQEIIEEVHQAYEIGITIAHLHARDTDQSQLIESRYIGRYLRESVLIAPD